MIRLTTPAPAVAALLVVALLLASPTVAADMPRLKPGLWQIDTEMAAGPAMGPMKQCVDEKTDTLYQQLGGQRKDKCSESDIKNNGDKILIHSVCKAGNSIATTDATFSGRFDSDYRGDIRVKYDPPMHGMSEASMTLAAKWLGPCEAGQQPGDVILPNGMRINPQQKRGARQ